MATTKKAAKKAAPKKKANAALSLTERLVLLLRWHLTSFWIATATRGEIAKLNAEDPDGLPATTRLDTVLDNVGDPYEQDVYRQVILVSLERAKIRNKLKPFPQGWPSLTVTGLANKLVLLIAFFGLSTLGLAQGVKISIGAVNTDQNAAAIKFAFEYMRALDSAFKTRDYILVGKNSAFLINPSINANFGNADAIGSIVVKMNGLLTYFKNTTVAGFSTPDTRKTMHTFPIGIGVETTPLFNIINAIGEIGWQPRYQVVASDILKQTKLYIGVQAGHKFWASKTIVVQEGGLEDQSLEKVNNNILRAHGMFSIDTKKLIKIQGLDAGFVGSAGGWYDALNGVLYHRIDAATRFYLSNGMYLDLLWERGSGPPFFNDANQWGLGFTKSF